jgi:MoaA/NifB/PqqE/SkfB family radical SAM enzyme
LGTNQLFPRHHQAEAVREKQKLSGREYPLIAVVVVNNKCNWDCVYCFGDYPNRKEKDYTTDELKFLVDQLYDMGLRYINMHGGETLLRPDVGELVNYIKNKGMYLCLITNGSILHKKIDEVRNVDNITISLDGSPRSNDVNRGKGAFDKTLAAIDLVLKEKIPLRVSVTLTRESMNDIGYMAELAKEKNFHLYYSILFKPLKKAQHLQMSAEEIRNSVREMKRYKEMGYPIFTSDKVLRATYEWPVDFNESYHLRENQIPASYRPHHIKCYYSRTKFTIEADGYIYPCFLTKITI